MGAVRAVVLGEGAGDLGGEALNYGPPVPRAPLLEDMLGVAHLIVRAALQHAHNLPEGAILFERPLLLGGREARGSDLLVPRNLGRLLAYPDDDRPRPSLVAVLVDEDGDGARQSRVHDALRQVHRAPPTVIGVAVRELEAWLITDAGAVQQLGLPPPPADPSSLGPGEAKLWLADRIGPAAASRRRDLARALDIETCLARSRSLARLVQDIQDVPLAS